MFRSNGDVCCCRVGRQKNANFVLHNLYFDSRANGLNFGNTRILSSYIFALQRILITKGPKTLVSSKSMLSKYSEIVNQVKRHTQDCIRGIENTKGPETNK